MADGDRGDATVWRGYIRSEAIATNHDRSLPAPVPISIECLLYINGVYQGSFAHASGTGAATRVALFRYEASHTDHFETVCAHVTVGGEDHVDCDGKHGTVLPERVQQVVDLAEDAVHDVADPTVCEVTWWASPGLPPYVHIDPDGDTRVNGEPVWDCP